MENNSFDRLVGFLSSDERKLMLEKMQSSSPQEASLATEDNFDNDINISFSKSIKNESIFYRFFLWIKSIFANTSMEVLYNEDKIAKIAKHIDKISPDLIDFKSGLLLSTFYNKLNELSLCADFFRPFVSYMENDENSYLLFLSSIVLEDVEKRMEEEANPYSLPTSSGVKNENRMNLIRKMESIIDEIPPSQKDFMYSCVQSTLWLKQFTKLPFQRFLNYFSAVQENNYSCSFKSIENEINLFAKVLCNGMLIPKETFESLFLFARKSNQEKTFDSIDETMQKMQDFLENATSQISMIKMFIQTVPLKLIGCIVYEDAKWTVENLSGGEDWFQKYKALWRKVFDKRWENYVSDCKLEEIKQSLSTNFKIDSFPLLPERPWTKLWNNVHFRIELSAGFLNWFMKNKFSSFESTLKLVMVEGDFVQKENREEFFDSFNKLVSIAEQFQILVKKISPSGEFGSIFKKILEQKIKTVQSFSKMESMIYEIEGDFRSLINGFCDSCRTLELCFTGIFHEKKDSRYDGLTNLNRISGIANEEFQQQLSLARVNLKNAFSLIKELEPIEYNGKLK